MIFKIKRHKPGEASPKRVVWGSLAMLGTNLAAGFAVFVFLGYWADHKFGSGSFWTLFGAVLGIFYMIYEVWKAIRAITADFPDEPSVKPPAGSRKPGSDSASNSSSWSR
jgi:F0F1-type ATP synthase assembly protein I